MKQFKKFDLTQYNSYRIKAIAREVFFPEKEEEIIELYKIRKDYILIGSGHNLIFTRKYYEEPIIIFNGNYNDISLLTQEILEVEAGAFTKDVCEFALENSLSGFEMFYDIPSSIGGAVVMNAGASGEEIKDILLKVKYLDLADLTTKEINNDDIKFGYRDSFFQRNTNKVILKVWLQLYKGQQSSIKEKMEHFKSQRWSKQPKNFPNAGSVFKRPKGFYVGAMIEELGLKGFTVGGAKISEKHGGFIVNFNNATGQDILTIISTVQKEVKDRFNVNLEVEQRIV